MKNAIIRKALQTVKKAGVAGTGAFDSRGEGGMAVEFGGQVTGVSSAPLSNILGGLLWIPSLDEIETPHLDQVEMNFALRDEKKGQFREQSFAKLGATESW